MKQPNWRLFAIVLLTVVGMSATSAQADWKIRGDKLSAQSDAKELKFEGNIVQVMITCQQAPVIINTVVLRLADGGTENIRVAKQFAHGEKHILRLGNRRRVVGLRISDDGDGKYRVLTR